jgi:hypothetical protein
MSVGKPSPGPRQESPSLRPTTWWPGCQTASAKKRLSKVQKLACLEITGAIRRTPTGAMEALTGLPPLDLVIQEEESPAAHRLWSLGCRSYFTPVRDIVAY